jgi:hypothetical protein
MCGFRKAANGKGSCVDPKRLDINGKVAAGASNGSIKFLVWGK